MAISNPNQYKILVVDDDRSVTASLSIFLKRKGFLVEQSNTPQEATALLKSDKFQLVIQDMNFSRATSGEEGLELLAEIKQLHPNLPVILMTAWGTISLAVEGMRLGASDFISKPWDDNQLLKTIATAIGLNVSENQNVLSRKELDEEYDFSNVIGESPAMLKCLNTIARIAKTDASVLILGESGTGKEVISDAIHKNSSRAEKDIVKVNLGGITPSLFESEMFGHVKGAFTDAKQDRTGRFGLADQGTLFLDEIGELDKSSQVKLLRVLQDQNFQMVGSSTNTSVDVRVISATNQNLEQMVNDDLFREDLFYRINLITIELPPLRDRVTDIPLLAKHHLTKVSKMYGMPEAELTPQAIQWLQQQPWPGNIRQLCQTIERVLLMSGKTLIEASDFAAPMANSEEEIDESFSIEGKTLNDMEKMMIEKSIAAYNGNISKVAEALGISRAALYRRLEKHGIST